MTQIYQSLNQHHNNFIVSGLYSMNPQNMGDHIGMHHSSLWRKSMWGPKDVPQLSGCHKQLNQLGSMGDGWRQRNNFIKTNYSFLGRSSLPRSNKSAQLTSLLQPNKKQSENTKTLMQSISIDADRLDRNDKLVEGMQKLRELNLLSGKDLNKVKFPGIIKHQHIYNDYHGRVANPGFSRNYQGKFYTK